MVMSAWLISSRPLASRLRATDAGWWRRRADAVRCPDPLWPAPPAPSAPIACVAASIMRFLNGCIGERRLAPVHDGPRRARVGNAHQDARGYRSGEHIARQQLLL